ncbi:MAG TPA: YCF48-related protein, partial [Ignavibacteria bacterium]|nr:YCF48-related protein [Ignavibacteria bacterium]
NTGWVCTDEMVLKTTNGGQTWESIPVPGYHEVVSFVDEDYGWMCGLSGSILKTTNGGLNWTPQNSGSTFHFNDIQFYDRNIGFAAGFGNTLIKTTNGGDSWVTALSPAELTTFHALQVMDPMNVFVTADLSCIYRSSDGGQTWDSLSVGMPNPFFSIFFINNNTGWVSGCCGMYFKTTDAGISWTPETYLTPGLSIYSADFINANTGWISADAGYIFRTTNGGETWDSLYSGTNNDLRTIQFVNDSTGWVVGYDGTILKTTNGGGQGWSVGIQQISNVIPDKYLLGQNYPNPFNPSTTIGFSIPEASYTELKIYDITGKEISELVGQVLQAGSYNYSFNASELNSGIYFYTLKVGDFIQTRKMVLIK